VERTRRHTNFYENVAALSNPTFGLTTVNWTAGTSVDGGTNGVPMGATTPLLGVSVSPNYAVQWGTQAYLYSDAANVVAQRNGTTGQTHYVYGTYSDASDWERAVFACAGGLTIGTQQAGTGLARAIFFMTGGLNRWTLFSSGGALAPTSNAGSSLGATGAAVANIWQQGVLINSGTVPITPTTGQTVTVANNTNFAYVTPAGALAALTVQFPVPLGDGHTFELVITQAITTLTLTPNSGATIAGGFTTTTGYSTSKWRYVAASTAWARISS
jgi:hypothetical protein